MEIKNWHRAAVICRAAPREAELIIPDNDERDTRTIVIRDAAKRLCLTLTFNVEERERLVNLLIG